MKKPASLITYISALVIGVILLILNEKVELLKGIVIAIGVLITVPSALMLISSFVGKKNEYGVRQFPAWYTIIVALAGLVLGIWILVMPSFFVNISVYTLGVGLVLVGIAQIVFIVNDSKPYAPNIWWYCVPVLVITGGLIICFVGPQTVNAWATLTTGILLVVYSVNGIGALGREAKVQDEYKAVEAKTKAEEEKRDKRDK